MLRGLAAGCCVGVTWIAVLVLVITHPLDGSSQRHPRRWLRPMTERVFVPEPRDVPNPERGFFHQLYFYGEPLIFEVSHEKDTLVRLMVRLDSFRSSQISVAYLAALEETFRTARKTGLKLIVRCAYNDGPNPNPEPDAPLERALEHIEQLGPVFETNRDVVVWFEAGFIGAWGEWHSSTYRLDSPANRLAIRDALFAHFPQDRFVLFRYPGDIVGWYPQPLAAAEAFSGSAQGRVGHHNDCFLASADDAGTYLDADGVNRIQEWQTYLSQMTRFVPMSGETCAPNPPRSDCPTAVFEMTLLHWSALNEDWHPQVVEGWRQQGCYEEIRQRLGYRLVLKRAVWDAHPLPGGTLRLWVELRNEGFASPLLPRPAYLVLLGQGGRVEWPVNVDPRRWEPGEHTVSAAFPLPQDLPPGHYRLGLWLPDPALSLQHDPRYAIRMANEGVWEPQTGFNILGEVVVPPRPQGSFVGLLESAR